MTSVTDIGIARVHKPAAVSAEEFDAFVQESLLAEVPLMPTRKGGVVRALVFKNDDGYELLVEWSGLAGEILKLLGVELPRKLDGRADLELDRCHHVLAEVSAG